MQNKSNVVTREEERFDSRAIREGFRKNDVTNVQAKTKRYAVEAPAANDSVYEPVSANDESFDVSREEDARQKPTNVRFVERTGGRGVAGDVRRRVAESRTRGVRGKLQKLRATEKSGASDIAGVGAKFIPPQAKAALTAVKGLKKIRGIAGWGMIAPVGVAYLFQLTFAIVSLVGWGIYTAIQTAVAENKIANVVAKVVNLFTDINEFIPGDNIGYIFWMLALLTAVGVFVACTIIFYLKGGNPFDSTLSFLIAAVCLAGSMLPVLNLLPLMLLWVIYVNTRSTVSLFSS